MKVVERGTGGSEVVSRGLVEEADSGKTDEDELNGKTSSSNE